YQRVLRRLARTPTRELLTAESAERRVEVYASAWLLVHYLVSARSDAFVKLQEGFVRGLGQDAAWAAAFPDLPVDRLDQVLQSYLEAGDLAYYLRPVRPFADVAPTISVLSSAD